MEIEQDDILQHIAGIKRAEPDPGVYAGIRAKIAGSRTMQVVRRPYVALAAACLTVLLTANIWALSQSRPSGVPSNLYQVETANFNLY